MFDYIDSAIGFIAGGGAFALFHYLKFLKRVESSGIDPVYIEGRGDRSPHVHSFDTMDAGTNGKWVCGICRKEAR